MKQKICKICREPFSTVKPLQSVCSLKCAITKGQETSTRQARTEAEGRRKERRAALEKVKTRSQWMKEAQAAFNAFIRARDDKLPCVSCVRHHQGQYHAGHYRTVGGNPELRFNELNVWKQCAPCNDHLHGNLINYRIELIKRIGQENVDWLEGAHQPAKYSIEGLKNIKAEYRRKLKELT